MMYMYTTYFINCVHVYRGLYAWEYIDTTVILTGDGSDEFTSYILICWNAVRVGDRD